MSKSQIKIVPLSGKKKHRDHAGKRFGRLVAIECVGRQVCKKGGNAVWRCKCDCGEEAMVVAKSLLDGTTQSCGCLWRETLALLPGKNALPSGESAFRQLFYSYKKSARERGRQWSLTSEQFRAVTSEACYYCDAPPALKFRAVAGSNGSYFGSGVDRIDNTRGYEMTNVRPCCKQCNIAKGSLTEREFVKWLSRAAKVFRRKYKQRSASVVITESDLFDLIDRKKNEQGL